MSEAHTLSQYWLHKEEELTKLQKKIGIFTFMSGGIAGATSRFFVAPFDRIITMQQLQLRPHHTTPISSNVARAVIFKSEGIRGFYKGCTINCLRAFTQKSILFGTDDFLRNMVFTTSSSKTKLPQPGVAENFICGGMAGVLATLCSHPIDLVRVQYMAALGRKSVSSTPIAVTLSTLASTPASILPIANTMSRGLAMSCLGSSLKYGLLFSFYYASMSSKMHDWLDPLVTSFSCHNYVCPSLSGAFASTSLLLVYPIDTVRKKLMAEPELKISTKNVIKSLYREGGVARFYKGVALLIPRAMLSSAITFNVYENLKRTHEYDLVGVDVGR